MATIADLQNQVDDLSAQLATLKAAVLPVKIPVNIVVDVSAGVATAKSRVMVTTGTNTVEEWVDVTDKFTQDELLALVNGLADKI